MQSNNTRAERIYKIIKKQPLFFQGIFQILLRVKITYILASDILLLIH
jgi:hypothetical protein